MFDPITIELIKTAPELRALNLETLPYEFTNAFAEIVAERVRLRGVADTGERGEVLVSLLEKMRRLAAAQELLVTTHPNRSNRAAAAFIAGMAHQLCLMGELSSEDSDEARLSIDAVRVAPEICSTLLFLIADAQSDAAEMSKRLATLESPNSIVQNLTNAIADLAAGRLQYVANRKADADDVISLPDTTDRAVNALLARLHDGLVQLAQELLDTSASDQGAQDLSPSQFVFKQVIDLCISSIEGIFDEDGPTVVSVFSGPLHLAKLLFAVAGNLVDSALCRIATPPDINPRQWKKILTRAAHKRPYLWSNHREAIKNGYLESGTSAVISFPTGGGKSTLAELKIATTLLLGKKAVILAPTLALVDQTASTLQKAFEGFEVQGDLDEEITFDDDLELPSIIVTTPERCLMLQSMQPEAFTNVGLVMFDECHLLHPRETDRSRRSVDSMLCLLNLTHLAPNADLLLISAMMQNAKEIAGWVEELTNRECLALDLAWKPTRQARGCVAYSADRISELNGELRAGRANFTTKSPPKALMQKLHARPLGFFCLRQTWETKKRDDYALMALLDDSVPFSTGISKSSDWYLTPNGNGVAASIAAAAAQDHLKTLTFVQSTVIAESTVRAFRDQIPTRRVKLTSDEKEWRRLAEEELGGSEYCYLKIDDHGRVVGGAASHHSGLLKYERMLHESLFKRRDGIDALFATSTLAQGMNLPSDVVLIAGDSRWDVDGDKLKQLDAHELLNAAGRAGRAGEGGQGFVLVIPSKVIDIDDQKSTINRHWMTLQGIFSQSDQCLVIDDPLTGVLDQIHAGVTEVAEKYFLTRLPVGDADAVDEPAKQLIRRSFAAYRQRKRKKAEWIEERIASALRERAKLSKAQELTWLERVAASCGLPYEVISDLAEFLEHDGLTGSAYKCMSSLLDWIDETPEWLYTLVRPENIDGLFGAKFRKFDTKTKAETAMPVIRKLLKAWMAGKTLYELELAIGTKTSSIKTCETARHFALRLSSDLAFVAGLPARILAAKKKEEEVDAQIPITLLSLSGAVRRGCASVEILANAVILPNYSRPAARKYFESIKDYLAAGSDSENFEGVMRRVKKAHKAAADDDI
ncbi:DEAD/DEAH box helicase [Herbaspirillum seropedicae]|uniref:DEAD/DEAH box helicase n=1 Tax=Herbaspirillum seropedicae TaxID=964 RepID=UPI00285AE14B|nr:DEAD/DEAH box helicase [Herbaspirillum seropedicae]MDR6398520.1 superfamily II DNA/RNA helicase [Herbaspirillum seropedicae]